MGTIDAITVSNATPAERETVHCFGERGMQPGPHHAHRMPIAAGLFGVPARCASPSNDGAPGSGCSRTASAA